MWLKCSSEAAGRIMRRAYTLSVNSPHIGIKYVSAKQLRF